MAKIAFSKLGCKTNTNINTIDFNGNLIEVKEFLPTEEKLKLMGRVIELAHEEDYNYSNPVKRNIITTLEILFAYTNITFTEKQKEDPAKLYDLVTCGGLVDAVFAAIDKEELKTVFDGVEVCAESIYKYQNSIAGIFEMIKQDYSNIDENAAELQAKIRDPENLELLKSILNKLD